MPPLLDIENLSVAFETDDGRLTAADRVSLRIERGRRMGLVGESGCGKSVTALSILRLIPRPPGVIEGGRIRFHGHDLLSLPADDLRTVRGRRIAMIFQEPMTALSPLRRIGGQLAETLRLHRDLDRKAAMAMAGHWLRRVGIPDAEDRLRAWPHQLSGGMRQRVMIAMALMLDPALLIADEPTTALDVTVQAQILDLIRELMTPERSLLLITHDMGVIWEMCSDMAVMYAGQIVETGPVDAVFAKPLHPYTEALLAAIPGRAPVAGGRLPAIPGQVPSPRDWPAGCRFADRCPKAFDRCRTEAPAGHVQPDGRTARCHLAEVAP